MFTINNLSAIENGNSEGRTDVILHITMPEEFYKENTLDKEEYPEDSWCLFITQEQEDRETGGLWINITSEGMPTNFELDTEEENMVIDYIKNNKIDVKVGLVLTV